MSVTGPIVVHTGPIVVHTAPVVHTSDTATTVIAALGLLFALAALGWQAWTFPAFRQSGDGRDRPGSEEHHARDHGAV